MSLFIRPSRFLKLRISKRGVRAGIGPRWFRFWSSGGDDDRISTGAGPVTYYWPLRRRRGGK